MKKMISVLLSALLALSICACGEKKHEEPVSEQPVKEEQVGGAAVANPMQSCASLEELNEAVGGKLCHPGVMGVTDESFNLIRHDAYQIAQYQFSVNGVEYSFRFSPVFEQDISGIYDNGKTIFADEPAGDPIYAVSDSYMAARWCNTDGQYVLSVSDASKLTEEQFRTAAEELIDLTNPAMGSIERTAYYASLAGEYQDSFSQRAVAEVTANGSEGIAITVHWGSSASEYSQWTMNATLGEDGLLNYSDCSESIVETKEDGTEEIKVIYTDGMGFFSESEGKLYWNGAADESCRECVFEKV